MTFSKEFSLVLGIDIGTSGVRAVLMNSDYEVIAQQSRIMTNFGANHRDPVVWWETLESTLDLLREEAQGQWDKVAGIAVDGTSGTLLALNNKFEPIGDAMMYNDPVADADALEIIHLKVMILIN